MADDIDRDIEVQEGEEVAGKTIVGGRPLKRRDMKMSIPAGIEKTLYKASIDPDFRARLLGDRFGAIEAVGFRLTDLERRMLESIPDARLDAMVSRIRPEKHGQRKFMKAVATAVVTLAAGTSSVVAGGCNPPVGGAVVDPPDVTAGKVDAASAADATGADAGIPIQTDEMVTRGVAPDEVEVAPPPEPVGGIMPDEVELETEPTPPGGAAADYPPEVEVVAPPPNAKGGVMHDMPDEEALKILKALDEDGE